VKRSLLLVATQNRHKVREVGEVLSGALGWNPDEEKDMPRLASLADFPEVVLPEESGASYRENAELKARAAAEATGLIALADDSGIEVDALSGEPGLHSARWLGDIPQPEKNQRILESVKDLPLEGRRARFRCAVAVCTPAQQEKKAFVRVFEATLEGFIADRESGDQGFGYDPIFVPAENGRPGRRTLAEFSPSEKNSISHRGKALRLAAEYLASLF
jgi:XTP/dITP diphosphohydrolase